MNDSLNESEKMCQFQWIFQRQFEPFTYDFLVDDSHSNEKVSLFSDFNILGRRNPILTTYNRNNSYIVSDKECM